MKKKQLVILLVSGLIMALIVFGPILTNLITRLNINKQLKKEFDNLQKKQITLEGIDRNLVTERVTKMELVFPSEKPVVQLLSTLAQLSKKHNLSFGGVMLRPGSLAESADSGLKDLKFGFQIGGDFGKILAFMKDLERAAPLMKIDKLGLTIKSNPLFIQELTLVMADIDVSVYFQSAPKTIGTINKPVVLLNRDDEAVLSTLFTFTQFPTVLPVAQTGKTDLFEAGL